MSKRDKNIKPWDTLILSNNKNLNLIGFDFLPGREMGLTSFVTGLNGELNLDLLQKVLLGKNGKKAIQAINEVLNTFTDEN
jgi:hypothetical protein